MGSRSTSARLSPSLRAAAAVNVVAMEVEDAEEVVPEVMTVDTTALDLTEAISVEIWAIRIRGPPEIRAEVVTVEAIEDLSTKQN